MSLRKPRDSAPAISLERLLRQVEAVPLTARADFDE
jgi:hypothetical protein